MEAILEGLDIEDFDGETFIMNGPQRAPFDIMEVSLGDIVLYHKLTDVR